MRNDYIVNKALLKHSIGNHGEEKRTEGFAVKSNPETNEIHLLLNIDFKSISNK